MDKERQNPRAICDKCPDHTMVMRMVETRDIMLSEIRGLTTQLHKDVQEVRELVQTVRSDTARKLSFREGISMIVATIMLTMALFGILINMNAVQAEKIHKLLVHVSQISAIVGEKYDSMR